MAIVTVVATPDLTGADIKVDVTFANTAVTACKLERKSAGASWVTVRSGASLVCVAGKVTMYDHEAPFDTLSAYRATQVTPAGTDTGTSANVTLTSTGYTWLKDPAYPSRDVRLDEVTSLVELAFASRAGVFAVIDRARPVVVAAKRAGWAGELKFTTATDAQRVGMEDLLSRGQVLLLSTPEKPGAAYGVGNVYVHVGDVSVERVSSVVTDLTRAWTLPLTSVDRPATLASMPMGMRWADVKNKYATWQALADSGLTWNQLLESTP